MCSTARLSHQDDKVVLGSSQRHIQPIRIGQKATTLLARLDTGLVRVSGLGARHNDHVFLGPLERIHGGDLDQRALMPRMTQGLTDAPHLDDSNIAVININIYIYIYIYVCR